MKSKTRRFRVEHKDFDKPITYITLHNPPYEDENVLSRTKWKVKDCIITDVTPKYMGEE